MTLVVSTVLKLAGDDEAEKAAAQKEAKELISQLANAKEVASDDAAEMESQLRELTFGKLGANETSLYPRLEEAVLAEETDVAASALVETSSQVQMSKTPKSIKFILIVLICFIPFGLIWVILDFLVVGGPLRQWYKSKDD